MRLLVHAGLEAVTFCGPKHSTRPNTSISSGPSSWVEVMGKVLLDNPVIGSIAPAHERTPAQGLLAWHVQRGISAIPKSVTPARRRENLAAAELTLTPTELDRFAALDRGYRMIAGASWALEGSPRTLQTIWDGP